MPDETPSTPSTSTPAASTRGRGTPRPRAGIQRKTKAEREQFAKEEAERRKARAAEHEAATRGSRGSRGVSRGGRGSGVPGQRDVPARGGGIFGASAAPKANVKQNYEGLAELVGGGASASEIVNTVKDGDASAGGSGGTKSTGRTTTSKTTNLVDTKIVDTLESNTDDELDDEPKRDIDTIAISSDEDEEVTTSTSRNGKQKATSVTPQHSSRSGLGLRPVRAPRTLGPDERVDGQDKAISRKKRPTSDQKPDPEVQELSSDEKDGNAMEVDSDTVQFVKEQPSSPEMRKRALRKTPTTPAKYGRDMKTPAYETIEERAERLRIKDDVEKLRGMFKVRSPSAADFGDKVYDKDLPTHPKDGGGKLLLFQLPPLTPFLFDPTTSQHPEVKTESLATNANGTTIDLDTIPDAPDSATGARGAEPLSHDGDPSSKQQESPTLQNKGLLTATEPTRLPAGVVGKLNLHKSGKVTIDWGGTDMEVRLGSEVDFLQDVVLVQQGGAASHSGQNGDEEEENDMHADVQGEDGKANKAGRAIALGQVRSKMVLVPDWARLYD